MCDDVFVKIKDVNVWYGKNQALKDVNIDVPSNCIYAFIGPSGCGKTTLLRSVNRLNDLVPDFRLEGEIWMDGLNVYSRNDKRFVEDVRKQIGMVFQQPNPLPMTVMQNMLLPAREHLKLDSCSMSKLAEEKLRKAAIYDEIEDRLDENAFMLSGGQQQRLCIARSLMLEPVLMLFDEPCSALDPISTFKIEELLMDLKRDHTIIMVTHNMEQARRIADYTAFFYRGEIVETGKTFDIFSSPENELTRSYITGRM